MALRDETYMALTTFRRDGRAVTTPVWVAPGAAAEEVCFTTPSDSGKVKRLRHTPRVTVQPSDARGRTREGTASVEATARLVEGGRELADVSARIARKYGFRARAIDGALGLVRRLRGGGRLERLGVVVTLPPGT